ncbi:MAG TPA: amino acid adenylation domain-containing protein [Candidatus Sulfotelmatobacter sp.]|nr:amino acid adenylation domain-containing protein [Candidatus Sulfotelmatobacter sp.]
MPEREKPKREKPEREKKDALLHHWLTATADALPNHPALIEDERVTTFADLLCQARSLACLFQQNGIQKGDRIALVMPKTTEAIVSLFSSLFAGAICVPIHPQWPKDRVEATLSDSGAKLVIDGDLPPPRITDLRTRTEIPWPQGRRPSTFANTEFPAIFPAMEARDPALMLFTSGSTGRPKGVVLSHRAIGAFASWSADQFEITSKDRIACPAPLSFDLSTLDIFNMALRGATCMIVPESIAWMPRFLVQWLSTSGATCWYSVPSLLGGMLHQGKLEERHCRNLRLILFAGEVFPGPHLARLRATVPHALLANLYGPTETNVVTYYEVPQDFDGAAPPPIGRACPYADVRVDPATGELLAGGESLMTGYWNRPDDTRRAFCELDGKTFYRTGDVVSVAPDGDYIFAGRLDRQVKRRGFRIELGEIEAAFSRSDDILDAAAVSFDDSARGTMIAAFLHLRPGCEMPIADAKAHCARLLPLYMVPDRIMFLEAIPKGSRGKTDYAALKKLAEDAK